MVKNNFVGVLESERDLRPIKTFEQWKMDPSIDFLVKNRIAHDGRLLNVQIPPLFKLQDFNSNFQESFGYINGAGKEIHITGKKNIIEYVREKINGQVLYVVKIGALNYIIYNGITYVTHAYVGSYEFYNGIVYNNDHICPTDILIGTTTYTSQVRKWFRFDSCYIDDYSEGFVVYMRGFFYKFKTFWTIDMAWKDMFSRGIRDLEKYDGIREFVLPSFEFVRERPDKHVSDNPVSLINSMNLGFYSIYLAQKPVYTEGIYLMPFSVCGYNGVETYCILLNYSILIDKDNIYSLKTGKEFFSLNMVSKRIGKKKERIYQPVSVVKPFSDVIYDGKVNLAVVRGLMKQDISIIDIGPKVCSGIDPVKELIDEPKLADIKVLLEPRKRVPVGDSIVPKHGYVGDHLSVLMNCHDEEDRVIKDFGKFIFKKTDVYEYEADIDNIFI